MVCELLRDLAKEKIVPLEASKAAGLPFPLEGVVRLVDKNGHMLAVVLDRHTWSDFLEYLEYSSPEFWNEIELSRKSGRVSSKEIERKLGIK